MAYSPVISRAMMQTHRMTCALEFSFVWQKWNIHLSRLWLLDLLEASTEGDRMAVLTSYFHAHIVVERRSKCALSLHLGALHFAFSVFTITQEGRTKVKEISTS